MVLRALVVALALSALALPALAQQGNWYLGLRGGATWLEESNNRPEAGQPGATSARTRYDTGYNAGGFAGYELNPFRIEGEVTYRDNGVKNVTPQGGATIGGRGDVSALSFMSNIYYDFATNWGVTPYFGLGIGFANVKANGVGAAGSSVTINDDDMRFAYQGIGGVSYAFNPQWSVSSDYRYFATLDPRFSDNSGVLRKSEYRSHNVTLSLTYHFAAPPAPMPVAAPAPPPPPQAAAASPPPAAPPAVPRTYLVFFDFDKSDITAEAARILKDAADNAKKSGVSRIMVTGHTDTVGTAPYNQRLSERRAAAVRDFLVREGLTTGQITTVGRGKSEPLVPTGDGVREARNRRAEIVFP